MFGFGGCGRPGGGGGGGGFGFGPPPWAQRMRFRGGGGPAALFRDLDLSDEQLEKLAELKMEGLMKFSQFKSSMIGNMHEISKELANDQIDRAKVKEIAQRIKQQKSEFGDSMIDRILNFAEVLSGPQRKKLRKNLIKRFLGVGGGDCHGGPGSDATE